jgi:hypothetical protein
MTMDLDPLDTQVQLHQPNPPKENAPAPHIKSLESYKIMYEHSVADPELFFGEVGI